jgi:hypothetical protein
MFKFGHKSKDKDQKDKKEKDDKKKEKKEKKEKEKKDKQREPMTEEEINRLDEVKKGIFRRFSERDKSKKSGHKSQESVTVLIDCGLLVLALRILFGFGAGIGVNFLGSGIGRTDRSSTLGLLLPPELILLSLLSLLTCTPSSCDL